MHEEGLLITYISCSIYRTKPNGQIFLRRKYYDYYYNEHCLTEEHIKAMNMHNNRKLLKGTIKMKSYT